VGRAVHSILPVVQHPSFHWRPSAEIPAPRSQEGLASTSHGIPLDLGPSPTHQRLFCSSRYFQCKTFLTLARERGWTSVAKRLSGEMLMMWKLIVPASTCPVWTGDCCSAVTVDVRPWKGATRASLLECMRKRVRCCSQDARTRFCIRHVYPAQTLHGESGEAAGCSAPPTTNTTRGVIYSSSCKPSGLLSASTSPPRCRRADSRDAAIFRAFHNLPL